MSPHGGVFKVAGKLYPHPELAWAAALKHVPFLNEMSRALSSVGSKVQGAFVKKGASTKPASSMKAPPVSRATDNAKKSQKADKVDKKTKTEPKLPKKVIVEENGIQVKHYTKSGDPAPAHLHVKGGGKEVRIGQNGKPLKGSEELTAEQKLVVENNLPRIRNAVKKIQKWYKYNSENIN